MEQEYRMDIGKEGARRRGSDDGQERPRAGDSYRRRSPGKTLKAAILYSISIGTISLGALTWTIVRAGSMDTSHWPYAKRVADNPSQGALLERSIIGSLELPKPANFLLQLRS